MEKSYLEQIKLAADIFEENRDSFLSLFTGHGPIVNMFILAIATTFLAKNIKGGDEKQKEYIKDIYMITMQTFDNVEMVENSYEH